MSHLESAHPHFGFLQKPVDRVTDYFLNKLRYMGMVHVQKIHSLPEVLDDPLLAHLPTGHSIGYLCCDWDGVIKQGFFDHQNGNDQQNAANWSAFCQLTQRANKVSIWSSRIHIDESDSVNYSTLEDMLGKKTGISHFPFVTDADLRRLRYQLEDECPDTMPFELDFKFSLDKVLKRASLLGDEIESVLRENKPVFIVGSSMVDHIRLIGVVQHCQRNNIPLNNLHYFTTGRLLW